MSLITLFKKSGNSYFPVRLIKIAHATWTTGHKYWKNGRPVSWNSLPLNREIKHESAIRLSMYTTQYEKARYEELTKVERRVHLGTIELYLDRVSAKRLGRALIAAALTDTDQFFEISTEGKLVEIDV